MSQGLSDSLAGDNLMAVERCSEIEDVQQGTGRARQGSSSTSVASAQWAFGALDEAATGFAEHVYSQIAP